MKTRFFIYGLVGWIAETLFTGIGSLLSGDLTMRSQTYIWMFPIYGLMIFLEPIHDNIRNAPVVIRGGVYTIIIFAIEYVTGGILKEFLGRCPWNYGIGPYSIDGIITLSFIPVWFIGGLLFEKLHDYLLSRKIGTSD
ncbi:MAG: putative ABC transporter permease [Caulobacteraceae bacterium]